MEAPNPVMAILTGAFFYAAFLHQRKTYTKIDPAKCSYFFIASFFLFFKVICRKTYYYKFIFIRFTQFLQIIILPGIATV